MLFLSFFIFLVGFSLVGWTGWQYVRIVDLKKDRINSTDFCKLYNKFVLWEYGIQATFAFCCLAKGYYLSFLLNVGLGAFHANKYMNNNYLLDDTTVWNFGVLETHSKNIYLKGGMYLALALLGSWSFAQELLHAIFIAIFYRFN